MRGSFCLFFLIAAMIGLSALNGCAGGAESSSGAPFWGAEGDATQACSISGTLRDAISNSPVEGAACTLLQTKGGNFIEDFIRVPKEMVTVSITTTGADGTYRFTGVPSGTYALKFTRADYITLEVNDISVTGDTAGVDRTVMQTSQWNQIAGPEHPYDLSKNYLVIEAGSLSRTWGMRSAMAPGAARVTASRVAGVTASIIPSDGVMIGYFTDSTPPGIDWGASSTYSNGKMIFYGLMPGVQYSISFVSPGYLFPVLTFTSSGGGGVLQNYSIVATAPNPNPSPSPTPTPSTTVPPQPSHSPTQSPGGGGGGGAPTLVSVNVTPENAIFGHGNSPSKIGKDDGGPAVQQFKAKANYSDGSEVEVTATCTWTTTSTVGAIGVATGIFTADDTKKCLQDQHKHW
ncbi:MAG: carboxypeptidase regulatory-like domain-containing protein [Vulcanimicrobiota bacterium]